jgi:cytochrome c2
MLTDVTDETPMSRLPCALVRFASGPAKAAGRIVAFALLLAVPGVSAWAQSPAPAPAATVAAMPSEWEIFAKKGCARCHRVRGMGDGAVGPDLGSIGARTGFYEIGAAMWNHLPRMRQQARERGVEWPVLTPQELSTVIALLFTAQRQNNHGDPVVGERLFVSKGCERCHEPRSAGGSAGPPLDELRRSSSPMLLAAVMWNHGTQMGEAMEARGVGSATLAGADLPDIVAYVLEAGRGPRGEAPPTVLGVAERGSLVFAEKGCARCHAVGGRSSPLGPSLGPHTPRATATELAGRLWNHGPAVRAYMTTLGIGVPRLAGQEMADIAAYLHASSYFDPAPGDGDRGQRLVQDKGCLRCHSIFNKGGGLASDLALSNVVSSQHGQLSAMWNHGRQMENAAKLRAIRLATLTGQQLSDISRYLAGLGTGAPIGTPRPR